jgi:hypothetical protein
LALAGFGALLRFGRFLGGKTPAETFGPFRTNFEDEGSLPAIVPLIDCASRKLKRRRDDEHEDEAVDSARNAKRQLVRRSLAEVGTENVR